MNSTTFDALSTWNNLVTMFSTEPWWGLTKNSIFVPYLITSQTRADFVLMLERQKDGEMRSIHAGNVVELLNRMVVAVESEVV